MSKYQFTDKENLNLERYKDILINCQKQLNLISNNTLENIWERHIIDSAQLYPLIKNINAKREKLHIADLGSGAGFPGVVLSILDEDNSYFLIESNSKKANFLKNVKKELNLSNVEILNVRIEELIKKNAKYNIVLSRALSKLEQLYDYARQLLYRNGVAIFPKGESFKKEVNDLLTSYPKLKNSIKEIQSITSIKSKIIEIDF